MKRRPAWDRLSMLTIGTLVVAFRPRRRLSSSVAIRLHQLGHRLLPACLRESIGGVTLIDEIGHVVREHAARAANPAKPALTLPAGLSITQWCTHSGSPPIICGFSCSTELVDIYPSCRSPSHCLHLLRHQNKIACLWVPVKQSNEKTVRSVLSACKCGMRRTCVPVYN